MALVRWSPWQGLFDIQRDMDVLMRRLTGSFLNRAVNDPTWVPAVDVFHRDKDLVVRAELPGVDPERDVEIVVQNGVLGIRGERRHEDRTEENGISRYESSYGTFERSVLLPEGVNDDDIQATYEHGILEVVVPRAAELSGGRRIPVQAGNARKALTTKGRKA
jgi:HSP20 family protein